MLDRTAPAAVRLLPDEAVDVVFRNADIVLREVGVRVAGDDASLDLLRSAGITVIDDVARAPLGALRDIVAMAPATFVQHARDPRLSLTIGSGVPVFIPVYGAPNVLDADRADGADGVKRADGADGADRADGGQRRLATMRDYDALLRIADAAPAIGNTGHLLCVPDDVPEPQRYEEITRAHLSLSGKPFMGATAGEDVAAMVIRQVGAAFSTGSPSDCRLLHLINSIPPLTFTDRMLGVLRASATSGQGSIVTSFQMLGATGPAAVLGALTQGLAEVLLGMALAQLHRPAAPVVLGIYGVPFDMRAMLPRFGDPISHVVQSGAVQIARRLGVPALGYGGLTSSVVDDAQAGYESASSTSIAVEVGADVIIHAAGWLENGRTVGIAKFRRESAALIDAAAPAAIRFRGWQ